MHKEIINYTDYNGEERSEAFYFNMTQAELMKLEMRTEGGMENYIEKIINEHNQAKIIDLFCDIIKMSYGVKSLDGGFEKTDEAFRKFESSEAYSVLFMRLATDADYAAKFINGVMPKAEDVKDPSKNSQNQNILTIEKAKQEAQARLEKAKAEDETSSN